MLFLFCFVFFLLFLFVVAVAVVVVVVDVAFYGVSYSREIIDSFLDLDLVWK